MIQFWRHFKAGDLTLVYCKYIRMFSGKFVRNISTTDGLSKWCNTYSRISTAVDIATVRKVRVLVLFIAIFICFACLNKCVFSTNARTIHWKRVAWEKECMTHMRRSTAHRSTVVDRIVDKILLIVYRVNRCLTLNETKEKKVALVYETWMMLVLP